MITHTNSPIPSTEHLVRNYMVTHVPKLKQTDTIADAHALLWKHPDFDTTKYLFVIERKRLIGIVTFKDLFRHNPDTPVSSIMRTHDIVTVNPNDHDEQTVYVAIRYGLAVVPVVEYGRFVGVVPSVKLLTILQLDATEEIAEASEVSDKERKIFDDVISQPIAISVLQRSPWLLLGLLGGLGAAVIIEHFESILSTNLILVSYIPLIVFLAGAISAQMQMFFVRDIALDIHLPLWRYIGRQSSVVAGIGVVIASILFMFNSLVLADTRIALVISIATFTAAIAALVTGIGVPYILSRLLRDPASATPPIAIILSDLITIFLYFMVATWLL